MVTPLILTARGPGNESVNRAFGHHDSSEHAPQVSLCCQSGMTKFSCLGYLEINVQADVDCCWCILLHHDCLLRAPVDQRWNPGVLACSLELIASAYA